MVGIMRGESRELDEIEVSFCSLKKSFELLLLKPYYLRFRYTKAWKKWNNLKKNLIKIQQDLLISTLYCKLL